MSITATVGTVFRATAQLPAGLSGSGIGVRITHPATQTTALARTTTVTEFPASSGFYIADLTAPATSGEYVVMWDTGGSTPVWASEPLTVNDPPALVVVPPIEAGESYATVEDVEARNTSRGRYTASTKPSREQVELFIEDAAAQINTALVSAGYPVPVDQETASPTILTFLRYANAVGAAHMVEWAAQTSDRRQEYQQLWNDALKVIRVGEMDLGRDDAQARPRYSIATSMFFHGMEL